MPDQDVRTWPTNSSTDDSDIPVPKSHKDELNKRLTRHLKSPGNLQTVRPLFVPSHTEFVAAVQLVN